MKINNFEVLEEVDPYIYPKTSKTPGKKVRMYKARCICGKEIIRPLTSLRKYKSCGCLQIKNLPIGTKIEMLTIESYGHRISKKTGKSFRVVHVKCDCGNKTTVDYENFKAGRCKSCGCLKGESHKESRTRLYSIWQHMRGRCCNQKNRDYEYYGGRGITVCDEWDKSYIAFSLWAKENGYKDDLTIDRVDNNGNYEPSNCKWSTKQEQSRNKRNIVLDEKKVKRMRELKKMGLTPKELAKLFSLKLSTVENVIYNQNWEINKHK